MGNLHIRSARRELSQRSPTAKTTATQTFEEGDSETQGQCSNPEDPLSVRTAGGDALIEYSESKMSHRSFPPCAQSTLGINAPHHGNRHRHVDDRVRATLVCAALTLGRLLAMGVVEGASQNSLADWHAVVREERHTQFEGVDVSATVDSTCWGHAYV